MFKLNFDKFCESWSPYKFDRMLNPIFCCFVFGEYQLLRMQTYRTSFASICCEVIVFFVRLQLGMGGLCTPERCGLPGEAPAAPNPPLGAAKLFGEAVLYCPCTNFLRDVRRLVLGCIKAKLDLRRLTFQNLSRSTHNVM